jgi:hypothetical protein
MIEPRGDLGFALEPLDRLRLSAQLLMEHLDDYLAAEQELLAAVNLSTTAAVEPLAEPELA